MKCIHALYCRYSYNNHSWARSSCFWQDPNAFYSTAGLLFFVNEYRGEMFCGSSVIFISLYGNWEISISTIPIQKSMCAKQENALSSRDGIIRHKFNKRFVYFAPGYSRPFYWRISKKTILFSGFKNPYNVVRKPDKNSSLWSLEFMPRNFD